MIAIGFQDTYHVLPQKIKEKVLIPRARKPLPESLFAFTINYNPNKDQCCG
jgi:hypothetical protein